MTAKEKFEAQLNYCGLMDEWNSIGRCGRVAKFMEDYGEIVLFVHEHEKDKYTEIHYPSFDELRKNDKFVRRIADEHLDEPLRVLVETPEPDEWAFKLNLAKWLRYGECECPLFAVDVYFAADGMETSYKDFSDDPVGIVESTNNHNPALVAQINEKWERFKDNFKPILCSLYERDIDEITSHDIWCMPEWEDWDEFKHGVNTGEWWDYNKKALSEMQKEWDKFAHFYLQRIADDQDLETIITFVRYDVCEGTGRDKVLLDNPCAPRRLDGSKWKMCWNTEQLIAFIGEDAWDNRNEQKWWMVGRFSDGNLWMNNEDGYMFFESNEASDIYYATIF